MKKITVSVINDLVTDNRVHKVCESLHKAGYEVQLVGRVFRKSQKVKREYKTSRLRLFFNTSCLFYAEYNLRLFLFLFFSKADIFLANDSDTLLANFVAAKLRRKLLVFDAHEIFPEVPELSERKISRMFWTKLEDCIFPKLQHSYTVCASIANYYKDKYGINMQVVRNIPPCTPSNSKKLPPTNSSEQANNKYEETTTTLLHPTFIKSIQKEKKILLYQGAVNLGRGLEWVIKAMPYMDNCHFFILGKGDFVSKIEGLITQNKVEDRVFMLGEIPLEELPAYTQLADVGINLLANQGLNYYYSLPNRIFDFIRAGVPIVSTDFPEIRNIIAHYKVGRLISEYEPQYLAGILKEMLSTPKTTYDFSSAQTELTWENEEQVLLQLIKKLS